MMIKDRITFDRIASYPYGTSAGKVCKTAIKQSKYKMINLDDYTNENKIEHNSKWPYIPDCIIEFNK